MRRSYPCSSNASVMTTFRSGSIDATLASSSSPMPFAARIGVAMSDTDSIVNARLIGDRKVISVAVAQPPLAQLGLDQERHLERGGRALVGDARDADDDPAAPERVEGLPQPDRRIRRVEVVSLAAEMLDLLGHDPGPRGDDQLVVAQDAALGERDGLRRRIDPGDVARPGD